MRREFFLLIEFLIRNIDGWPGRKLRLLYYRSRLGACGNNVIIETGVYFQNPNAIFLGNNVWIDKLTILIAGPFTASGRKFMLKENANYKGQQGQLILGSGVHIAPFALLQSHGGLRIGNNVTVASGARIYTLSHHHRNLSDVTDTKRYSFSTMAPKEDQFLIVSPVVIEDNAAVGINSVILPGTTLREGSWLGVLTHLSPGVSEENSVYTSETAKKK